MRERECQHRRNSPNWTRETRTPKLPFGSHDMQDFFLKNCELPWARRARARVAAAGTRDAARSARFRTGQSPSAAGAAGGTEGLGVTLSLCRHSRMPRHLTARVDSMRQTTPRARRREEEMARGLRTEHFGANEAGARDLHSPSLGGFDGFQSPSCTMRRERRVSMSSIHEFDPGLGSILRVRLLGTRSTVRVHEPYPCLYPRYRCPASPSPRPPAPGTARAPQAPSRAPAPPSPRPRRLPKACASAA
jgi:hypothetical protein